MMRMAVGSALLLMLVPSVRADEKRYEFLLARLEAPISIDLGGEAPLENVLVTLEDLSSLPGYEKDPAKKVRIRINEKLFRREQEQWDVQLLSPIRLPGKMSGVSLATVLKLICDELDAVYLVRNEFIEIVPAARFRRELGLNDLRGTRSLNPLVHCNFKKIPLPQALEALAEISGRSIVLSQVVPDEIAKREITIKLANTPFETALEFMAAMVDLKVVARGDAFLVTNKKQAEELQQETRRRDDPDNAAAAVDKVRTAKPVHLRPVFIAAPAPKNEAAEKQLTVEQMRKTLDSVVNVEASQITLAAFLNKLTEDHKIPFTLDRLALNSIGLAEESIMVDSNQKNVKLRTGLRNILNPFSLTFVIIGDQVVVTTEEIALHKQFKQRINLELNEVPLAKAMKSLAQRYGVNIVLDPKCVKAKTTETSVTLELDDVALEAAIRVMSEMAGLKATRFGNIVYITTEDRADKINKDTELFPHSHPEFPGGVLPGGPGGPGVPGAPVPPAALAPAAVQDHRQLFNYWFGFFN